MIRREWNVLIGLYPGFGGGGLLSRSTQTKPGKVTYQCGILDYVRNDEWNGCWKEEQHSAARLLTPGRLSCVPSKFSLLPFSQFDLFSIPCEQRLFINADIIVGDGNKSFLHHTTWQHSFASLPHFSLYPFSPPKILDDLLPFFFFYLAPPTRE